MFSLLEFIVKQHLELVFSLVVLAKKQVDYVLLFAVLEVTFEESSDGDFGGFVDGFEICFTLFVCTCMCGTRPRVVFTDLVSVVGPNMLKVFDEWMKTFLRWLVYLVKRASVENIIDVHAQMFHL